MGRSEPQAGLLRPSWSEEEARRLRSEFTESRGNDTKATFTYTIQILREEDCKYRRIITPAPVPAGDCDCFPKPPAFEPPPLTADAPAELKVCAGERFVLTASGSDRDTLKLECLSTFCGTPKSAPVLIDELKYTWSAMTGTFPDYGGVPESNSRHTSVIYKAPDLPGEDMVTVTVADSGQGPDTPPVEKKIKIKVIKVDLQVEGVAEAEEECPGKMLCENDDDHDENLMPDNSDTAITGTDAQKRRTRRTWQN